jgi:dolichyl-phosphate-mannose-protein mannosyltransferase
VTTTARPFVDRRASIVEAAATARPWVAALALGLAVAIGSGLRVLAFLGHRSLWMDESMFALNIALRPARELVPLPLFEQVAPPVFIWLERASVVAFGVNEYALRLIPLVAGCLLLPTTWYAARRLIGPRAALIATWAVAASPLLVRYSAEAKPYALDALVATALLGLAAQVMHEPDRRARWIALLIGGVVALALSMASVFVLAAIGLALFAPRRLAERRVIARLVGIGTAWCAAFALLYVTVYDAEPARSYMRHFWSPAFLGSPHSLGMRLGIIWEALTTPFVLAESGAWGGVIVAAMAVGAVACLRRGRWIGLMIAGPIALAALASFARLYPFGGRVALFAVPLYAMLAGAGVAALTGAMPRIARLYASLGFGAAMLLQPGRGAAWLARSAEGQEDPRAVVQDLLRRAAPDEPIYLYVRSVPNWLMYSTDWAAPDTARAHRLIEAAAALGPNSGNAPTRGHAVGATEGDTLRFPFRGSVEILGLPSGIENFERVLPPRFVPDTGWVEREVARIRREARPRIWMLVLHFRPQAAGPLVESVCAAGGRIVYEITRREAAAYQVDFSPPSGDAGGGGARDACPEVLAPLMRRAAQPL